MTTANGIRLHQTLHGYADGHQLLAGSLPLTREQQWQMLVMSDLSGPSFRLGFDAYLTGYPLETGGYYCLARTWFAHDLPRPGCVWTHTLLVSDADVARITDLRVLNCHFRRPSSAQDRDEYNATIDTDPQRVLDPEPQPYPTLATALITLLYDDPARRVVLTAAESHGYEDAIAAIFRQQWPRLRRSFRFCTGALAIRDIDFDLAIAPRDVARQDTQRNPSVTEHALGGLIDASQQEEWIRVAARDLIGQRNRTSLRDFLWRFGPDYSQGRAAFRPLCEIFRASTDATQSIEEVLTAIGHFFPDPQSSRRLKATFFGVSGVFANIKGESAVLGALVSHPAAPCIPPDLAVVSQRAEALARLNPRSAIAIGSKGANVDSPIADEYLTGLSDGLRSRPDLLTDAPSVLVSCLLQRDPDFLRSPSLWKVPGDRQAALAANLASLPRSNDFARGVTTAVLEAHAWVALRSCMSWFGVDGVTSVLDWIESSTEEALSVPASVLAILREHRGDLVSTLSQRRYGPRALLACAALLDPRSRDVRELTRVWAQATGHKLRFVDPKMELRSKTFLLSVGLSVGSSSLTLVRESFSAVYDGAKKDGGLDDSLWAFIEPYLPWYRVTWDRCARLIRGVVRQCLEGRWPAADFILTFQTAEQLDRALEEASESLRGARYVRRLCQTEPERLGLDDARASVIARFRMAKRR